MSRIAGIWNLDRTPVESKTIRIMMGTVAPSLLIPPSEPHIHVRGEIGLGYRPTFVRFPPEDGILAGENQVLVVVADARLDNRDELIAILDLQPCAPGGRLTDAELIASVYRRWGPDGVAHLLGAFAFALWDPAERWLLCARDHVGLRPLYYQRTARRFTIASEVKQILALSDGPTAFNEAQIGQHLAGAGGPHDATYFAGIVQVPPAHLVIITPEGEQHQRYWDVDPQRQIRYRSDAEYGEHFRELFVKAIRCRLRSHESTGVLLSGGLDSSSVASAVAWLHEQGEDVPWPLHTFTWLYDELSSADEREYSAAVNEAYGLTAHSMVADNLWPLRYDSESITDLDEPFTGYYYPLNREILRMARDEGIDVILTGNPGDNLVGANVFAYPDLLRHGQWIRLIRELLQHSQHSHLSAFGLFLQACIKPAAPLWLRRWYQHVPTGKRKWVPEWIAPEFSARIDLKHLVEKRRSYSKGFSRSKGIRYRTIFHPHVSKAIIERDRQATHLGMVNRVPWLDKRLIEFVMAIPIDQTIRSGLRKIVLRNAMQGILPEKVRTRRYKTYPTALAHRGLRERERARVEDLLTNTRMAQYGWVIEEPMRQHYARYAAGELDTDWPLWQALTLELWLREHF